MEPLTGVVHDRYCVFVAPEVETLIVCDVSLLTACTPGCFFGSCTGEMHGHKVKSHPAPESRVGEEGTSKRNITRKGGVKVIVKGPIRIIPNLFSADGDDCVVVERKKRGVQLKAQV